MTLKEVFSISGKPGLFKLISNNKMPFIVEDLATGKKLPIFAKDRIIALGDISMYTEAADTPLGDVFENIYGQYDGQKLDEKALTKDVSDLKDFMSKALPGYDKDRVHNSDIKKLIKWYNILIAAGMNTFKSEEKGSEKTSQD